MKLRILKNSLHQVLILSVIDEQMVRLQAVFLYILAGSILSHFIFLTP